MKKPACTLIFGLLALRIFAAEVPAPENAGNAEVPALEVKNKSSFTMEDNSRNPFWPIGWKPAPKQTMATTEQHAGPEISPASFIVSSITVDQGGRFAIINGKTMTEGQVFGLLVGNQTYQITVKSIGDGQVILLRRDQEIAVPLRRR
ncbi:MAG: hypothetical protein ABR589_00540 [Chthoniobacterales bacterium]